MGYDNTDSINPDHSGWLVTNLSGIVGNLGISPPPHINSNRFIIKSYQPDLFLALAGMSSSMYGNYGEYYKLKDIENGIFGEKGSITRLNETDMNEISAFIVPKLSMGTDGFSYRNSTAFEKCSKEDLINHFENPNLITIPRWNMIDMWACEHRRIELSPDVIFKFSKVITDDNVSHPRFRVFRFGKSYNKYTIPLSKVGICSLPNGVWGDLRECYDKITSNNSIEV